MAAEARLVGETAELEERRLGQEPVTVLPVEPLAREDLLADALARQFHTLTTL